MRNTQSRVTRSPSSKQSLVHKERRITMKTKVITPEMAEKQRLKREKEIAKWEREKARPKRNMYFVYLVLIIALIYATDEIASQIGTLMKDEIARDLFPGDSSNGLLDILGILSVPFSAVGLLYRPLADRWGRKIFLIINTVGMSIAMFLVFLSRNVMAYFIGAALIQFFIPHDMHVVYIMESAPSKNRARTYSTIKFAANLGVLLVPVLRQLVMKDDSMWRNVFLVPAIVGIVTCLIALLCARETDPFIEARLKHLRMSDEERAAEKEKKNTENAQGGLIPALKFAMSHKQLKWLFISAAFANIGFISSINYQPILSNGYTQFYLNNALATADTVENIVSTGPVTMAIYAIVIGSAFAQIVMGYVSDSKFGRKTAAIVTAADCVITFVLFTVGSRMGWNPYIVGFFCGAFVGSYYSTNDVIIMMVGESCPTNLRSSSMSAHLVVTALGGAVSYLVWIPVSMIAGDMALGTTAFCLLVPGYIAALITLWRKTAETKGIDMDTVTGLEWD